MIKIFLVEDEIIMRDGIKNNIPWREEGYDFVGDASDGELAYPMIRKLRPDILITDIHMPFMDGLELSALVKKELPKIKIIILSGYSDFDYAKQAIRIGVTDYLLKPVTGKSLLEAVGKVAAEIRKESEEEQALQKYREEMQENVMQEKQRLFYDILTGRSGFREIVERGSALGLDFAVSFYQVMLFKLTPPEGMEPEEIDRCQDALSKAWKQEKRLMTFTRGYDGWALVLLGETEEQLRGVLESVQNAIGAVMAQFPKTVWFAGLGNAVSRLNRLSDSYHEANKAFAGRFFTDGNQVLPFDRLDASLNRDHENVDVQAINTGSISQSTVEKFLSSGVPEEIDGFIEEYFQSIGETNYNSLIIRRYLVMDCYFAACNFLKSLNADEKLLPFQVRNVNGVIRDSYSMETIRLYLRNLFGEAMKIREKQSEQKFAKLIESACLYIGRNSGDEALSLNSVAAHVGLSASYFSTVFRQQKGATFSEYLTHLRMEKAKELLMCTDLNTAQVSDRTGYRDPHYFGYLFKKLFGCTPREYRTRGEAKR